MEEYHEIVINEGRLPLPLIRGSGSNTEISQEFLWFSVP